MLFSFFSRHPLWFMNSTKHVTHSTIISCIGNVPEKSAPKKRKSLGKERPEKKGADLANGNVEHKKPNVN